MEKPLYTKNIPTVFVIFGATGDLMTRKITPALFHLYIQGKLPKLFRIIGFSRRDWSEQEFKAYVKDILKNDKSKAATRENIEAFVNLILYQQGNFQELTSYTKLAEFLGRSDNEWKVCSNKLFYLAVPPQYYRSILENLHESGLTIPCSPEEGYTRILVEKPFGHDLQTAEELDELLGKLFKDEQIYPIDHYLAKEMLQNIVGFRFTNNLFEKIWDKNTVEKIEVRLLESDDVEQRGEFYDGIGALRDVGQNHLLQMLALVTMEQPKNFDASHVRKNRARILETLKTPTTQDIQHNTFRAQYKGYRETKGVDASSNTETYFKVKAYLKDPKWEGVPIILEGGKNIIDKKEIVITFKHPLPCLCPSSAREHYKNRIIFSLEPKEEIKIEFWSKKPGLEFEMQKQTFSYLYRDARRRVQYVEEYEKLLLDCILGNQLLFVSTKEVKAMWKFIDPIICEWQENAVPLHTYEPHKRKILIDSQIVEKIPSEMFFKKNVGIIGLGKMGGNTARLLSSKGWNVYGYNRTYKTTEELVKEGIKGVKSIEELVSKLPTPRIVVLSLPAGDATREILDQLVDKLSPGDFIIDMANAFYKDTIENYKKVNEKGIHFVDVGISGGPGGALRGACLMIGGEKKNFDYLFPLFSEMALPDGVKFFEGAGAGHFVKMVHNGIEYGMMQAIAEGFEIMKNAHYTLSLTDVADIYNHGSVVESRLTKWLEEGLTIYGEELSEISGSVPRGGEGDWTVNTAKELGLQAKVIEESVKFRMESEQNPSFAGKILQVMRNMFGGHAVK